MPAWNVLLVFCASPKRNGPHLSVRKMKERNRVRLKEAALLEKKDYQVAISVALGVDSNKNIRRQSVFSLSMAVLNTPGVSAADLERAETELAHQFGLYTSVSTWPSIYAAPIRLVCLFWIGIQRLHRGIVCNLA